VRVNNYQIGFISTHRKIGHSPSITLSGRSHTSEPEPRYSQHEPPSTPTRFYKPSARCAPDRT
jgi:hypothetical protein